MTDQQSAPERLTPADSSSAPPAERSDERIIHRGPVRRWLISPEVGALIGAVVVWLFLWGNGETFGTAGTTLNWLDVAAPYGIMATAVALLMIGGEFDLSAGVMTGASAMIIGLFSRFYTGSGVHIALGIAAAFAAAIAIGWFNGYMVNRTGLPSFIITLASFFVMRGLMLVLSKRLAEKVYVDQIKDQRGAAGFGTWIAHEWILTEFPGRDPLFVALTILGGALITYGLLELSFSARARPSADGIAILAAGLVVGVGGFVGLLRSDGVAANFGFGLLTAFGALVAVLGLARVRWEPHKGERVRHRLESGTMFRAYVGVLGMALACVVHFPFDRNERRAVLSWIAPGIRPFVVGAAALIGLWLGLKTLLLSGRRGKTTKNVVGPVLMALYVALLLMTLTTSALQLATVQAVRAMAMILLGTGGVTMMLTARGRAAKYDQRWQVAFGLAAAGGLVAIGQVTRTDATAIRFRTVLPTGLVLIAAILMVNTLLEFLMEKRTYGEPGADRRGRRLLVAGGLSIIAGAAVRLLYSNASPSRAAKLREAGLPVPQNVLRQTVLWWILVAALGAYVLAKTQWGNWIFAVGGNKDASRAVGVPADRVKIGLFMVVSLCGALSGTLIALRYGTVQADQGTGLEFEFIIAAVVGGCLMTGGYGSVVGASLGAAILAMSTTGFQTVIGWNGDGRYAFLGAVLLVAVLVNTYTRKKAQEAR